MMETPLLVREGEQIVNAWDRMLNVYPLDIPYRAPVTGYLFLDFDASAEVWRVAKFEPAPVFDYIRRVHAGR